MTTVDQIVADTLAPYLDQRTANAKTEEKAMIASKNTRFRRRLLLSLSALLVVCSACATARPVEPRSSNAPSDSAPAASAPKTLRIAFQGFEEPKGGIIGFGPAGGFDPLEHYLTFHASLTVYEPQGTLTPRLAVKVPNLQDGDWKAFPDGTMTTTWKLRDGAKWHDGAPLLPEDFAFGLQIVNDPELPATRPPWARLVSSIEILDPTTFTVHWKESTFLAGGLGPGDIPPLPTHLLEALYRGGDKQPFINSTYWTTDFIGLGPYRLGQWQRGSHIEGLAFEGYVLGRPKIDRIILSYVGDVNAIVAGVLSGDLDMVPMGARFDASQLVAVRDSWGPDAGSALLVPFGVRTIWLQFRDAAAPWAREPRVRRALVHSTDRAGMSDALQHGLTPSADTLVPIEDPVYRALQADGLARYPFDSSRARQLITESGWSAGADGIFRDRAGQPLTMEVGATGQGSNVQEIETVASQWQEIGIQASPVALPPQAANLDERKNTLRGGFLWPWSPSINAPENLLASQAATERTSWKGRNYAGYTNPSYDGLYERYSTTLDTGARQRVQVEMLKLIAEEVPVIPIYYYGNGVIARKGLSGPGMISPLQTGSTWNIHTWELR